MPKEADNLTTLCFKKAFAVSYALCRVSRLIVNKPLSGALSKRAVSLLDAVLGKSYDSAIAELSAIQYFIRLSSGLNFIYEADCQVLESEIRQLNSAIAELADLKEEPEKLELSSLFEKASDELAPVYAEEKSGSERKHSFLGKDEPQTADEKQSRRASGKAGQTESQSSIEARIRQSAILERIRQADQCRLREIQEFLPRVSERTLRYDLQKLSEKGLIRKVGSTGPSTFYKSRG